MILAVVIGARKYCTLAWNELALVDISHKGYQDKWGTLEMASGCKDLS
jgi:hypothetical protein